ncbi:MAG: zf-HC2 domain-containing protein [Chloroflexota bacterium]
MRPSVHLSDGEIRAFQDQELQGAERQRVSAHIASCSDCQEKARNLSARAQRVHAQLSNLQAETNAVQASPHRARPRLAERLEMVEQEDQNMWNKLTSRQYRPLWVGLAVIAVLAIALAFPSVQAIANSFLGLFRVEQIRVVQFDPSALPGQLESSAQLENILAKEVVIEENGEVQEAANLEEASALAGFAVRLPGNMAETPRLVVQPGGTASFNINLELVQTVLSEMGYQDIHLPTELDGSQVTLTMSKSVIALYGDCQFNPDAAAIAENPENSKEALSDLKDCTSLTQMPSPTISAPPGLDLAQIGEAYLQLLGMTEDEAARFARNVDWTTTFVIPVPRYSNYEDVPVDGVTGTLVSFSTGGGKQHSLLWVKDGFLYMLSGAGSKQDILNIAATIQ